jgi:hypothetical protein
MADAHKPGPFDKTEKHSDGNGDKPVAGAPITRKADNATQQRLKEREALQAFRLTKDPNNSFSIDMSDGTAVTDKRPISGTPKHHTFDKANHSVTDAKGSPTRGESNANERENQAATLISDRIMATAQAKQQAIEHHGSAHSKKDDLHISNGLFDGTLVATVGVIIDSLTPGDLNQKHVNDLGIEDVPVVNLKESQGTTASVDHALADAKLDPKHYNCNDYVTMFILSKESESSAKEYIKNRTGPSITDTPEKTLRKHDYQPINEGPLKDGDIIVIHGPKGVHSAVICEDPKTHELYTMQKPNPKEMPVRLSLDQLSRAEHLGEASVEVYRKQSK